MGAPPALGVGDAGRRARGGVAKNPRATRTAGAPADALALLQQSAAACDASLVIATHDQRVVQALAGVQQLNLNEIGAQRLLDKREQL